MSASTKILLSIIVAMDKNTLIGANGKMPWHLPKELQYFKRVTLGKPLIMGRKTFDSIGRALPGRPNIVITRQKDWKGEGVQVVHSLEDAIKAAKACVDESHEIMVIGGANIYAQAIDLADKLYITQIDHEFEGDTWLRGFIAEQWNLLSSEAVAKDDTNPYPYHYTVYERR